MREARASAELRRTRSHRVGLGVAIVATAIWLTILGTILFSRWKEVYDLTLNNLGDLLAGIFAPVAFLWLIVAVFFQKGELQLQRKELELSRGVLEMQAEELRNSARQLRAQAEILERQLRGQNRQRALSDIRQKVNALGYMLAEKLGGGGGTTKQGERVLIFNLVSNTDLLEVLRNGNLTHFLQMFSRRLDEGINRVRTYLNDGKKVRVGKLPSETELDLMLEQVDLVLAIPDREAAPEAADVFKLELPLNAIRDQLSSLIRLVNTGEVERA